jgi:hypothetical protein
VVTVITLTAAQRGQVIVTDPGLPGAETSEKSARLPSRSKAEAAAGSLRSAADRGRTRSND